MIILKYCEIETLKKKINGNFFNIPKSTNNYPDMYWCIR